MNFQRTLRQSTAETMPRIWPASTGLSRQFPLEVGLCLEMSHKVAPAMEPVTRLVITPLPYELTPTPALCMAEPRCSDETGCNGRGFIKAYFTIHLDNSIKTRSTLRWCREHSQ
jgi:hypothetical protein